MLNVLETLDEAPIVLRTRPTFEMTNDEFFQFCADNPHTRLERNSKGEILIMYPEGGASGAGNAQIVTHFVIWANRTGLGEVFGSSAGFILPNDAMRSPDVSWVSNRRLAKLNAADWEKFLPLCPDFVLELRSKTDSLRALKRKMQEYRQNGAKLGWLVDPYSRTVFVYRPRKRVEVHVDPVELSGECLLPGFTLKMESVWQALRLRR